ncbi:YdcF family protein [Deltaproteobacteria bacterium Smac51]|nr:YdcF family protein [Deltaproteobacteria bacterium Smac51]
MKIPRWTKRAVLVIALLTLAACVAVAAAGLRENVIAARVAVVLGNEVYRSGKPAPRLAARLREAARLYLSGRCSTIIVSGHIGLSGVPEAPAMAEFLTTMMGVPSEDIVIDSGGENTWRTAVFTAEYLKANNLDGVIAVSQYFHLPRTVMALEMAGCPNVGHSAPVYVELRDAYSILRELPAIAYYWLVYP